MRSLKIVIADDESIIRMDLRQMLEEAGHEVVAEATDGLQAIELARRFYPDLVIMDVKMPRMDGIEAAGIINNEHLAPVLLLTAYSQQDVVQAASASGVIAYLVKPIKEEQLFPAIEIAISRFGDIQELETQIARLKDTLEMRKLIERAKGILMELHGLNEDIAYKKLQQYAMNKRKSIKEIAQAVIKSYERNKD